MPQKTHPKSVLTPNPNCRIQAEPAQKRFGETWNRLSFSHRDSRPGCECSRYIDLSNVTGHKKCGSQDAACIYCTASNKKFRKALIDSIKAEINAFSSGEREDYYRHLLPAR